MRSIFVGIFILNFTLSSFAQWALQSPLPTREKLRSLNFINDTTGFVCGSFGNIKMTTNGGHSWTNLVNDTIGSRTLLDLDFVNTGSGIYIYLTAQDTSLFRAPIGTSNWERVSFLQNQEAYDGTVFFSLN